MSTSLNDMEARLCDALSGWVKAEAKRVVPLSYCSSDAAFQVAGANGDALVFSYLELSKGGSSSAEMAEANGDARVFSHLELSKGDFSSAEMAARWLLSCIIQDTVFEPPISLLWRRDPEIIRSHSIQGVSWGAYARFTLVFLSPRDEVRT